MCAKFGLCCRLAEPLSLCGAFCFLRGKSCLQILLHGLVLQLLRGLALRKVLRDSAIDRILCGLAGLERCHLRFLAEFASGKPLCKVLSLRLIGKLTRLQRQLRVLRNGLILCLLRLLLHAKLLARDVGLGLRSSDSLTKTLRLSRTLRFVHRHGLPKVLRNRSVDGVLRRLSRLERGKLRFPSKLTGCKALCKLLRLGLVRKLSRLQGKLRVLSDGLVLRLLRLLQHAELLSGQLRTNLCASDGLPKSLSLRGSGGFVGRHGLSKVLLLRLVGSLRGLLTHRKLLTDAFAAKLPTLQRLTERLLLRHVLRRLRSHCLLEILRNGLVVNINALRTKAKLLHGRLVGKVGEGLLFAQALLTHRRVNADALRRCLQSQIVFFLRLQFHFGVVRLTARAQTLVDKALFQLLTLTLQLRLNA